MREIDITCDGAPWYEDADLDPALAGAKLLWMLSGAEDYRLLRGYTHWGFHSCGPDWKESEGLRRVIQRETSELRCEACRRVMAFDEDDAGRLECEVRDVIIDAFAVLPYDLWALVQVHALIAGARQMDVGALRYRSMTRISRVRQFGMCSFVESTRPGVDCFTSYRKMLGRALAIERSYREGTSTNLRMIGNLLGENTVLGSAVGRCALRTVGEAAPWLPVSLLAQHITSQSRSRTA